jgi:hypothetical protein
LRTKFVWKENNNLEHPFLMLKNYLEAALSPIKRNNRNRSQIRPELAQRAQLIISEIIHLG